MVKKISMALHTCTSIRSFVHNLSKFHHSYGAIKLTPEPLRYGNVWKVLEYTARKCPRILEKCSTLQLNGITLPDDAECVKMVMSKMPCLTTVSLISCELTLDTLSAFMSVVPVLSKLRTLDVSYNDFSSRPQCSMEWCKRLISMERLNMSFTKLSIQTLHLMSCAMPTNMLNDLRLKGVSLVSITDESKQSMRYFAQFLSRCRFLKRLDVCLYHIDPDTMNCVCACLLKLDLRVLHLGTSSLNNAASIRCMATFLDTMNCRGGRFGFSERGKVFKTALRRYQRKKNNQIVMVAEVGRSEDEEVKRTSDIMVERRRSEDGEAKCVSDNEVEVSEDVDSRPKKRLRRSERLRKKRR